MYKTKSLGHYIAYLTIIMKLVFVVKVYWLFMVKSVVDVILFCFIIEMLNFCINNVVGKDIINKYLSLIGIIFEMSLFKLRNNTKTTKMRKKKSAINKD